MRRLLFVLTISVIALFGCSTIQENKKYAEIANQHSFEYYFPTTSSMCQFSSLDEAYDYVYAATVKLEKSINKHATKGLAAKLFGPEISTDKPVTVTHFFEAFDTSKVIDISKRNDNLKSTLTDAISVSSVFMVFYSDRGVSITDFLLADEYRYDNNAMYKSFNVNNNTYTAQYPVGWGINNAFKYLKKEID